ncbi:MAG: glycosyltransferase family 2 protein [Chlamydiae bacterium]|nr:glycosyltransferase family 2 protein [Chlamydiota bacterium]
MDANQRLQKILAIVILVLIPVFVLKEYRMLAQKKSRSFLNPGKALVNEYAKGDNKTFVVVIFSDEEDPFCEKNLASIFDQSYDNFRIVYLDSGPGENNYRKAKRWIEESGYQDRVTFVKNATEGELFSAFYEVVQGCRDEEVVVHLESTDWLVDDAVLEKLNRAYKDPDVWLTYGEYLEYPSLKKQELEPVINRTLRDFKAAKTPWMLSHLKTYYAGVLKQMVPTSEGLQDKASSSEDKMLMLSLLKIGKWHVRFIPEVLYVHQSD